MRRGWAVQTVQAVAQAAQAADCATSTAAGGALLPASPLRAALCGALPRIVALPSRRSGDAERSSVGAARALGLQSSGARDYARKGSRAGAASGQRGSRAKVRPSKALAGAAKGPGERMEVP